MSNYPNSKSNIQLQAKPLLNTLYTNSIIHHMTNYKVLNNDNIPSDPKYILIVLIIILILVTSNNLLGKGNSNSRVCRNEMRTINEDVYAVCS